MIPNRLINYVGKARATSYQDDAHSAVHAFVRQGPGQPPWASKIGVKPPYVISYRFKEPKSVTKIGFSSRIDGWWKCQSPKKFDVVAALDPQDCRIFMANSQVLLSVEDAGFQRQDQALSWMIPKEMQSSYLCIGIRIHSVIGVVDANSNVCNADHSRTTASVHNMLMWESRA